jgi:hypothetical protein
LFLSGCVRLGDFAFFAASSGFGNSGGLSSTGGFDALGGRGSRSFFCLAERTLSGRGWLFGLMAHGSLGGLVCG